MILDLKYKGLIFDNLPGLKGREMKNFLAKFDLLSEDEFKLSQQVSEEEFMKVLNQIVPCVGCRRNVERLFQQFKKFEFPTLDPIFITKDGVLQINETHLKQPLQDVCRLLQKNNILMSYLQESQQRNKKNSRCSLHSLDWYKSSPFSESWIEVWNSMKQPCKEEILIIEIQELQSTMDVYLKKHKFCHECSAKVCNAFHLLFKEKNPKKESGYSESLYAGIKRCLNKHIQLPCKIDFIDALIRRAEPELVGNHNRHRERHAKTLEIAQEEVLTCIGMCIFERFRRIHMCLKEEESACQVLAVIAINCLYRSFDLAVEQKRGMSNLELLYEEISREEREKQLRKEQKKLKKRRKKLEKKQCSKCKSGEHHQNSHNSDVAEEEEEEEEEAMLEDGKSSCSADDDMDDGKEERFAMYFANGCSVEKRRGAVVESSPQKGKGSNKKKRKQQQQQNGKEELTTSSVTGSGRCCEGCDPASGTKTAGGMVIDYGYVSETISMSSSLSSSSTNAMKNELSSPPIKTRQKRPESSHQPCSSPSTVNSQLSSLSSTPEGSEVACHEGCCNHSQTIESGSNNSHENHLLFELNLDVVVEKEHHCNGRGTGGSGGGLGEVTGGLGGGGEDHCSFIPEELINDFRSRHRNLKEIREEFRKNLRKNFANFCMKNKNRSLLPDEEEGSTAEQQPSLA